MLLYNGPIVNYSKILISIVNNYSNNLHLNSFFFFTKGVVLYYLLYVCTYIVYIDTFSILLNI